MGTYMGNVGHLMQHWTLCELLTAARERTSALNYIDAHAMSPRATVCTRKRPDAQFDTVRDELKLPREKSRYERAWHNLAIQNAQRGPGYPSSAAFVREVWNGAYSLLLCEKNQATAKEIKRWLDNVVSKDTNCRKEPELFPHNWRDRFRQDQGLPRPADPDNSLTLVSFDPHSYSKHPDGRPNTPDREILRPPDLELVVSALEGIEGGVLIQLSTYSNNGGNSQGTVICSANSTLRGGEFALAAVVKANYGNNKRMMSLVYARKVKWSAELAGLPGLFDKWRPR